MDDEKKPQKKKRLSAKTKAEILCVSTVVALWVLDYINEKTLESKGLEVFLMINIWFVAVFTSPFVKYWTGKFKD